MSVHKSNTTDITKISSRQGSRKAPVPQVDKEHFADMRKLERNPNHLDRKSKDGK